MSSALRALYAGKRLTDGSPPGFDITEMMRLLQEQEKAISLGDTSRIEEMLVTQAHVLQAIFSTYVTKAAAAPYLDHVQCFLQIALKAQNQCRQTLSTLADSARPNQTTYIAQQNNAIAQQVSQNRYTQSSEPANELLTEVTHEQSKRMESRAPASTSSSNTRMEALDPINRPKYRAG